MDGSTVLIIAMGAMMVLMCGGMIMGAGAALFHRRHKNEGNDRRAED